MRGTKINSDGSNLHNSPSVEQMQNLSRQTNSILHSDKISSIKGLKWNSLNHPLLNKTASWKEKKKTEIFPSRIFNILFFLLQRNFYSVRSFNRCKVFLLWGGEEKYSPTSEAVIGEEIASRIFSSEVEREEKALITSRSCHSFFWLFFFMVVSSETKFLIYHFVFEWKILSFDSNLEDFLFRRRKRELWR